MNGWAQPCGGSRRKRCRASTSLAYTLADRSNSGRLRRASARAGGRIGYLLRDALGGVARLRVQVLDNEAHV